MKARSFILLCLSALLCVLISCSRTESDPGQSGPIMRDGIWEGTGEGRGGTILVRITVESNIITDAKAMSQSESSFAQESLNAVLAKAIGRKDYMSVELDGVSGATLTSTGVIDALNMAIAVAKGEKKAEEKIYSDGKCDIVVVGAGGAGLCAAVEAAAQGRTVIVLEKQGIIGGNTNYSAGGINAAETSVQQELGIIESKDLF